MVLPVTYGISHTAQRAARSHELRLTFNARFLTLLVFLIICFGVRPSESAVRHVTVRRGQTLRVPPSPNATQRTAPTSKIHKSTMMSSSTCEPSVEGWDVVRGAALQHVGYHAAAVPFGRHVLVLGGVANLEYPVDVYNYTQRHTQRGMNLFDPVTGQVVVPEEILVNDTSVDCPVSSKWSYHLAEHDIDQEVQKSSAPRCVEARRGNGTTAAFLSVPVVGSGSTVQVRNRLYAFGACNTIPDGVNMDLLRQPALEKNDHFWNRQHVHRKADEETAPSPEAQYVENYLRSVLRIQLYQNKTATTTGETNVIHQQILYQPSNMALRFNATCVAGGRGIIYIIGGLDARSGAAVSSVAQFDTESDTFVDGVWSLSEPVVTPAAAFSDGLLLLTGGYAMLEDPTIFNPTRQRRAFRTRLSILDSVKGMLDRSVAHYAMEQQAATLQWTSPQLFVRGAAAFLLGSGGKKPYGGLAYWANMSTALRSAAARHDDGEEGEEQTEFRKDHTSLENPFAYNQQKRLAVRTATASENADAGTQTDDAGAAPFPSRSPHLKGQGIFDFAEFSLVPQRRDAVVAMWPSEDGAAVTFYLFGGRSLALSASTCDDAEKDVFKATFRFCAEDNAQRSSLYEEKKKTKAAVARLTTGRLRQSLGTEPAALPKVLGFTYARVMKPIPHSHSSTPVVYDDSTGATALLSLTSNAVQREGTAASLKTAAVHVGKENVLEESSATVFNKLAVPNNRGRTCVAVDGYTPLWYNISFSVLLSYSSTAEACPGIEGKPSSEASFSTCALRLSLSPQCDAALVEFRHLSPLNARAVTVPIYDEQGNVTGQQKAFAVAQTLLIGSLERGVVHVMATGEEGRRATPSSGSGSSRTSTSTENSKRDISGRDDERQRGDNGADERANGGQLSHPRHITWWSKGGVAAFLRSLLAGHHSDAELADKGHSSKAAADDASRFFYEKDLVYVCFSRRRSAVADCGVSFSQLNGVNVDAGYQNIASLSNDTRAPATLDHDNSTDELRSLTASTLLRSGPCSTRFYETLFPHAPFLLSPEVACANSSNNHKDNNDDDSDDGPVTPSQRHLLRPWMLLTTLIVLLVVIVVYIVVTFVLMPGYAFTRTRRRNGAGGVHNLAVVGGPDPDQQRSLLPYREARIFLGQGGVGVGAGGGGGNGNPYGLADDEVPDEYETALNAAGVGAGLTSLEASWDTADTATRRRRLLDGKYEVIRKLGKGSFSVVYLVRRITDDTTYALKYLQCSDDVDRHEAMKECEVVYALQGHPNVIQLFDMFMSYRFDRHMVTVPQSRKSRAAAAEEKKQQKKMKAKHKNNNNNSNPPQKIEGKALGGGVDGEAEDRFGDDDINNNNDRPLTVEIAGAEANPVRSRGSSRRLLGPSLQSPQPPTPQPGTGGNDEAGTDNDNNLYVNKYSSSALVDQNDVVHDNAKRCADSAGDASTEGAATAAAAASTNAAAPTTAGSDQPSMQLLTASSSNATSAATSATSRPIVHMDSTYFDAMTAGMLREDGTESPTTPSAQEQQQQQKQGQTTKKDEETKGTVEGQKEHEAQQQSPHHHQRGLSSLQAERYLSLVMAYHERGDLARWVRQRRALQPFIPEATIVSIAFQVLSLLSYMHHKHQPPIIHRDLKPENILLTTHVHYENVNEDFLPIVVTDFGLSRVMDKTFCETGVGSLPYVAPECWQRRYSTKVDIWALGCVLYAVCSKRVDSSNVKVMFSECTQPDFHARLRHELENIYGYSDRLAWFVTQLLAVNPDDRPTAAEALRMLRRQPTNEAGRPLFAGPPLAALLRPATENPHDEPQEQQPQQQIDTAERRDRHSSNAESEVLHAPRLPAIQLTTREVSFASLNTPSTSETSTTPVDVTNAAVAKAGAASPTLDSATSQEGQSDVHGRRGVAQHLADQLEVPAGRMSSSGVSAFAKTAKETAQADEQNETTRQSVDLSAHADVAAATAEGAGAVDTASSLSGPPSTRVASTNPPHSGLRAPWPHGASPSEDGGNDAESGDDEVPHAFGSGATFHADASLRPSASVASAASTLPPPTQASFADGRSDEAEQHTL